jgi:hypothetical protein
MSWAFLTTAGLGTLPFRVANLATLLEYLFHEIISGKGPARSTPVLGTSSPGVIGEQGPDLSLQYGHSFFNRRSRHDRTPASK